MLTSVSVCFSVIRKKTQRKYCTKVFLKKPRADSQWKPIHWKYLACEAGVPVYWKLGPCVSPGQALRGSSRLSALQSASGVTSKCPYIKQDVFPFFVLVIIENSKKKYRFH